MFGLTRAPSVRYNVHKKEGVYMRTTNATSFRKNLFADIENTIKYNEPLRISTKTGNAIMLSEDDYNGLVETLYLSSIPGLKDSIMDGGNTPISECLNEDEVW